MDNNFVSLEAIAEFDLDSIISKLETAIATNSKGNILGEIVDGGAMDWIINFLLANLGNSGSAFKKVSYQKVSYNSKDLQGINPSINTGLLIVPIEPAGDPNVPVNVAIMGYQHGTQLECELLPSQFNEKNLSDYIEVAIASAFSMFGGYVVAMPDYPCALSDPKCDHPYVVAKPLGISVADFLVTVKKQLSNGTLNKNLKWNNQLFLMGYSEGGYATLVAAREIQENYSDVFKVTAATPLAGPHDLSGTMRFLMLRKEKFEDGYFLPMTIRGYHAVYGDNYGDGIFTKQKALKPIYQELYDLVDGSHSSETVNRKMPKIPSDILSDEFLNALKNPESKVCQALKQNNSYNWKPDMPLYLYHDFTDDRVSYNNSQVTVDHFKTLDRPVPLIPMFSIPLLSCVHVEAAVPCLLSGYSWINEIRNSYKDRLLAGDFLLPGNSIVSSNGNFCLRYQLDGNLALYSMQEGILKWQTNTTNKPGECILQENGNLVVYDRFSTILWDSKTKDPANHGSKIIMQNDGNLVIYDHADKILWESNSDHNTGD